MPLIESLFNKYLNTMLKFMRKSCIEPVMTVDNNLVQSLMRNNLFFNKNMVSKVQPGLFSKIIRTSILGFCLLFSEK